MYPLRSEAFSFLSRARAAGALVAVAFPHVIIGVRACDGIERRLRLECRDYPCTPVTAQLWHVEKNALLPQDEWPRGQGCVVLAFDPGRKGGLCLCLSCHRLSIEGRNHSGATNIRRCSGTPRRVSENTSPSSMSF